MTNLEGSSLMLWGGSSVREHNPRTVHNICTKHKKCLKDDLQALVTCSHIRVVIVSFHDKISRTISTDWIRHTLRVHEIL